MRTSEKLETILRIVGHTLLSFVAALVGGFTFYTFFRSVIGRQQYSLIAKSPAMIVLLLIVVALWGLVLYGKWRDHHAFLAWLLPALWVAHLILSRGFAALQGTWADTLFFFDVGAAYSIGATLSALMLRTTSRSRGSL